MKWGQHLKFCNEDMIFKDSKVCNIINSKGERSFSINGVSLCPGNTIVYESECILHQEGVIKEKKLKTINKDDLKEWLKGVLEEGYEYAKLYVYASLQDMEEGNIRFAGIVDEKGLNIYFMK